MKRRRRKLRNGIRRRRAISHIRLKVAAVVSSPLESIKHWAFPVDPEEQLRHLEWEKERERIANDPEARRILRISRELLLSGKYRESFRNGEHDFEAANPEVQRKVDSLLGGLFRDHVKPAIK